MTDLERLQAAGVDALRTRRPANPPALFHLNRIAEWMEARHIEIVRKTSLAEARRAFNPVFIHLPADGCRLTELAARANMSKQAMAELVEELVDLGYLVRFPDPGDGRAKLILRSEKGLEAHAGTLAAFRQIDAELEERIGAEAMARLRIALAAAADAC